MKKSNVLKLISIGVDGLIVILGTIAILIQTFGAGSGSGVDYNGVNILRFFTNDGNIYCIIASLVLMIVNIISFIRKDDKNYQFAYLMKLVSAVTGAIIFFVVLFVLIPTMGPWLLVGYNMLVLHMINPLLIIASFFILDRREKDVKFPFNTFGSFAVLLYGAVAIILVFSKVWTGDLIPYPFLDVYNNPVWATILYMIGILGGSVGLSILFVFLNKIITNKIYKKY